MLTETVCRTPVLPYAIFGIATVVVMALAIRWVMHAPDARERRMRSIIVATGLLASQWGFFASRLWAICRAAEECRAGFSVNCGYSGAYAAATVLGGLVVGGAVLAAMRR